jgi:hypothetical protein
MTTLENANDGIPDDAPQEKLEWVTPKISLMATTETDGNKTTDFVEPPKNPHRYGPS